MQTRVNGAENHHSLLDQRHCSANRLIWVLIGQFFEGCLNNALSGVNQEAQKLEKHRARAVKRHRHGNFPHIVDHPAALDLDDLGGLDVQGLATGAALELQERRDVLDVGRVQQSAQSACSSPGEAANHVRQTDWIRAAPRNEGELNDPLQFLAHFIVRFPIPIKIESLAAAFVDADDVGLDAITKVEMRVDLKNGPQAVFVVRSVVAALDLVVRLRALAELGVVGSADIDIPVHPSLHTAVVFHLRDVLDMRLALSRVEVCRGKRQINVVNRNELRHRALVLRVPHELHVLAAAKRKLGAELLQFATELGHLLSCLPVHEVSLAATLGDLFVILNAVNLALHGAIGREDLFHEPRREVYAGLDEHGVNDLVRTLKLRATGRVIAQTSAAQAFLILLVALFAGFLVFVDLVHEIADGFAQHRRINLVNNVGEVLKMDLLIDHIVQTNDRATVLGVLDLAVIFFELNGFALLEVVVFLHGLRH